MIIKTVNSLSFSDIIVTRGIENRVAIDMMVEHIRRILREKSEKHQEDLRRLGQQVEDEPLSPNVRLLKPTPQINSMDTILHNPLTSEVDFIFYFDRMATLLVERFVPILGIWLGLKVIKGNGRPTLHCPIGGDSQRPFLSWSRACW